MHQPVEEENRMLILKLSNGDTVVGAVVKETQGYIEVSNPFRIIVTPTMELNMILTILRWDMSIDTNYPVRIFKNTIVACGKPSTKMMENYNQILAEGFDMDDSDVGESEENPQDETTLNLEEIEDRLRKLFNQAKTKSNKLH